MKRTKEDNEEDDHNVPASERRLKAAKKYVDDLYLSTLNTVGDDEQSANEVLHKKLRQDVLETSGKLKKGIASSVDSPIVFRSIRKHKAAVCAIAFSPDAKHVYSSCKQGQIVKCDVETGNKVAATCVAGACLCIDVTTDGKYLAAGTSKGEMILLDAESLHPIKTFPAHRGAVNGLSFRSGTHQLFTAGADKLVKVWEPDHGGFIEVLCGHTDAVTSISCLVRERPLTSGGQDSSLRIWKLVEESQLVYNMPTASSCADACSYIDDSHFLSGSTDGSLSLWITHNKSPLFTIRNAHGELGAASWVSSVAACPYSDLGASGAADGFVRMWELNCTDKSGRGANKASGAEAMKLKCAIPIAGCINALRFSNDGSFLAVGVGREHRFGRWAVPKDAKNCVALIRISKK